MRADRIKVLVWDQTGIVLVHKRLEGGKFVWPKVQDGVMKMSPAQFSALFEGARLAACAARTRAAAGTWRDKAFREIPDPSSIAKSPRAPKAWQGFGDSGFFLKRHGCG